MVVGTRLFWLSLLSATVVTAAGCDSDGGKKRAPRDATEMPDTPDGGGDGDGDGDGGDGDAVVGQGTLTGFVFEADAPYAPLAGITLSGPSGAGVKTAADGSFTLTDLPTGSVAVRAESDDYTHVIRMVEIRNEATTYAEIIVKRVSRTTFDLDTGVRAKDKTTGVSATFKGKSLVTAAGKSVSGKATVSIVSVADDTKVKTGSGKAKNDTTKETGTLKTTSVIEVRVTSEKGERLQLANGKEASIELPISSKAQGATKETGVWSLNEKSGHWHKEAGTATKGKNAEGKSVYKTKIRHMSWWEADTLVKDETLSCVRGCVKEPDGKTASFGANVVLLGVRSPYRDVVNTDADGCFYANLEAALDIEVVASHQAGVSAFKLHKTSANPKLLQTNKAACDDLGTLTLVAQTEPTRCAAELSYCNGACIDLRQDVTQCGVACGQTTACNTDPSVGSANGEYFENFVCAGGSCECPRGWLRCGTRCIDAQNDANHCGTSCSDYAQCDYQTEVCEQGACTPLTCTDGEQACTTYPYGGLGKGPGLVSSMDSSGSPFLACNDLSIDDQHCGACGNVCNWYSGEQSGEPLHICVDGSCECPGGFSKCSMEGSDSQSDFRCVDTSSDPYNCGGCGAGPGALTGVTCGLQEACVAGVCQPLACPSGQVACEHACVDPNTDPAHCGECFNFCYEQDQCLSGICTPLSCGTGGIACEHQCLPESDQYCGGCYSSCYDGRTCQDGTCVCPSGLTECSFSCTDLNSDPYNCNGCGTTCEDNQACVSGACAPLACANGLTACGHQCVDTQSNSENCGACGMSCSGGVCDDGECHCPQGQVACDSGFGYFYCSVEACPTPV